VVSCQDFILIVQVLYFEYGNLVRYRIEDLAEWIQTGALCTQSRRKGFFY